ncbi:WG repeat-containing protein [Hymenobacter sp. 15J16-1T3B]|uniref:WG repeat-containing protein n=1 Tax=Hymenobacter sp. 15J16-1T3B TaxID=2886941 RepID=UPI001D12FBD1|nr:WG repeat-containing protein [Hymenobacter sp. 15J16-1T3B]MCC3156535.1 WG repeat-containing protein [Hymenobacter sp. 15J16-1T3B]
MLHVFQPAPFPDPARQQLFETVRRILGTGLPADAPALLAGPLPLPGGRSADAVLVRPHSLTLLLLHPGAGGELRMPSFAEHPWQLNGNPLTLASGALNPYQDFAQLQPALLALLEPLLPPESVNSRFVTGLWLTDGPLRFGADVEASMAAAPEARQLQLLPELTRLPRRLAQLATPEIELTAADIQQLATALPAALAAPQANAVTEPSATLGSVVQNTARQLWRWLGAEDVDELPPDTYALAARSEDQKHQLEEQQAALQRQLTEQLRAIEAREAAREQSLTQLRAELARAQQQAAPHAAELQARLAAENRAKAAEESSLQAARAEWQRRNQDLDAKITALEQLLLRLQAPPAAPAQTPTEPLATPVAPSAGAAAAPGERPAQAAPVTGAEHAPPARAAASIPPGAAGALPRSSAASAASVPPLAQRLRVGLTHTRRAAAALAAPLRQRLPATDHWLWLALGGIFGLGLMLWLGTQVFKGPAPEPFQAQGRWGFARRGEPVIKAEYASVQPFQDERAVVERDGAFGAVDMEGQEVVPPAYDAMNNYAGGYARVRIGDLYTFVDADGQEFNYYFFNAYDFAEGYAPVLDRRGWYYISGPGAGVPAHPRVFQEAYPFRNGLARVRTGGAYTFITPEHLADSTRGPEPFGRYEQASDFADNRAQVQQNGRRFVIDTDGAEVTQ